MHSVDYMIDQHVVNSPSKDSQMSMNKNIVDFLWQSARYLNLTVEQLMKLTRKTGNPHRQNLQQPHNIKP